MFAQHLRVISAATLDRWPEVCQTSSFLRSISYCGRLDGWSFGKSSVNSTVNVTSGRGSARHDGKSRATSQGKKPGLAADGAKKGARLEGFQRYPKIMGMGWLLTFRQQQMFDWPIVACPIPMLAHPQILVARQLLAQVQSSSLFLGVLVRAPCKVEVAT